MLPAERNALRTLQKVFEGRADRAQALIRMIDEDLARRTQTNAYVDLAAEKTSALTAAAVVWDEAAASIAKVISDFGEPPVRR